MPFAGLSPLVRVGNYRKVDSEIHNDSRTIDNVFFAHLTAQRSFKSSWLVVRVWNALFYASLRDPGWWRIHQLHMMVSLEVSIPVSWKGKEHGKAHMKGCMEYGHIASAHTFWLEIRHTKLQGRLGNVPRKERMWIMVRAGRPCHTPLFPVLSMVEFPVSQGLSVL